MKIIFFGLGSIGMRHARLIKENFNHELYACRYKKSSKKNSLGVKEISGLNEIDKIKPDVAFITNPTYRHIEFATLCAKKGIDMFIEKPLSNSKRGVTNLLKIIRKNNVNAYVAYCMRFHPVIMWLKKLMEKNKPIHLTINVSSYLPDWREDTNHLEHYSAFKSKGGGVILELSHEIDYVYYLLGGIKGIKANSKKLSNLTVDSEDFVDILLESKKGVYCNLHLNFFSRVQRREIIMDFKENTVIADLLANRIVISKGNKDQVIEFKEKRDDVFLSQLNYFFSNLRKNRMMNNLEEASKVFDVILAVKKAAK